MSASLNGLKQIARGGGDHWMSSAVKHPGALTKSAHAAGESPMAFASAHKHSSGKVGQRARFALNAQQWRKT